MPVEPVLELVGLVPEVQYLEEPLLDVEELDRRVAALAGTDALFEVFLVLEHALGLEVLEDGLPGLGD